MRNLSQKEMQEINGGKLYIVWGIPVSVNIESLSNIIDEIIDFMD